MMKRILPYVAMIVIGLATLGGCKEEKAIRKSNASQETSTQYVQNDSPASSPEPKIEYGDRNSQFRNLEISTEGILTGLEGRTALEIQDMVLAYKSEIPEGNYMVDTPESLKAGAREARRKTMEMDLRVIEGIYAGTVGVRRTSEGYKAEGDMPSYGSLEEQMKSRLRVRMNADVNNDCKITPEEVKDLESYLMEKVAK